MLPEIKSVVFVVVLVFCVQIYCDTKIYYPDEFETIQNGSENNIGKEKKNQVGISQYPDIHVANRTRVLPNGTVIIDRFLGDVGCNRGYTEVNGKCRQIFAK